MNDDDFTDDWAAIKPAPKPKPPPPPPGVLDPGYLWVGLFDGDLEVSCPGYARQRAAIPAGRTMKFEVAFPQRMQCSVTGTGLFLCAAGGQMVWRKDMDRINTYELDTLHVTLTIEDANADYGEWAGFRKVLKMHGVL